MFKFQASTKLLFGIDTISELGREVRALGAHKVLIVTDQGIVNAGIMDKVSRPLADAEIEVAVFD